MAVVRSFLANKKACFKILQFLFILELITNINTLIMEVANAMSSDVYENILFTLSNCTR